jgi:hypothetical protein
MKKSCSISDMEIATEEPVLTPFTMRAAIFRNLQR